MAAPRWARVKDVLGMALNLPPGERAAYLDQARAGDSALRAEVESLIAAEEASGDFIVEPVVRAPVNTPEAFDQAERSLEPRSSRLSLKFVVSTTSVLPSHGRGSRHATGGSCRQCAVDRRGGSFGMHCPVRSESRRVWALYGLVVAVVNDAREHGRAAHGEPEAALAERPILGTVLAVRLSRPRERRRGVNGGTRPVGPTMSDVRSVGTIVRSSIHRPSTNSP